MHHGCDAEIRREAEPTYPHDGARHAGPHQGDGRTATGGVG